MAKKQPVQKRINILSSTFDFIGKYWTPLLIISLLGAVIWKLWRIFAVPEIAQLLGINLSIPYLPENIPLMPLTILLLITLVFAFFLFGLEQTMMIVLLDKPNRKFKLLISESKKHIMPVTTIMLLILLLLTAGLILLIVPFFILAFFIQFSVYLVVLRGKTGMGAILMSAGLVKSNFLFILTRNFFLWLIIIAVHLLTRKFIFTSIAYHTIITPFIVTYNYFLFKSLKNK